MTLLVVLYIALHLLLLSTHDVNVPSDLVAPPRPRGWLQARKALMAIMRLSLLILLLMLMNECHKQNLKYIFSANEHHDIDSTGTYSH